MASDLIYEPIIPDFSKIGDDIQEVSQLVLNYQRNKQRYEQQRKDMMMKNYLASSNIKPYSFIKSQNDEMAMKAYKQSIDEMKQIEDKDSWDGIIKANRIKTKYQQKIGEVQQRSKQYAEDRQMVMSDPYSFTEETRRGIENYTGGPINYKVEKKIGDFGKMIQEEADELLGGNERTVSWTQNYSDKTVTHRQQFRDKYYKKDPKGKGYIRNVKQQKQDIKNLIATNNKVKMSGLQTFRENGRYIEDSGQYLMPNGKIYSANPDGLTNYTYDMYGDNIFQMKVSDKTKLLDEDQFKVKNGRVNIGGYNRVLIKDDNQSSINVGALGGPARYWQINDENIDIKGTLNGAIAVDRDDNVIETKQYADFKRAELTGVVKANGQYYAQLSAFKGERVKKKKGKPIYKDKATGLVGTKKEILKQYVANEFAPNMKEAKIRWNQTRDDIGYAYESKQDIRVYAPVQENPSLQEEYIFESELQSEQSQGMGVLGINWNE